MNSRINTRGKLHRSPYRNGMVLGAQSYSGVSKMVTSTRKKNRQAGGYFNLQEEKTKTRVSGYGHGDFIKLKDEYGNIWLGSAETIEDNSIVYRFRDGKGKTLTGISSGLIVTLRDEKGNTWRGAVD